MKVRPTHWTMILSFIDYILFYTMKVKAAPFGLWYWDCIVYPLIYTMTGKAKPLDYDTEILQTNLYSKSWQVRPSQLDYELRLYRLPSTLHDEGKAEPIGLWQWDFTEYPLLYTITVKDESIRIWHWDSTDYLLHYTKTGKFELIRLWQWGSTD